MRPSSNASSASPSNDAKLSIIRCLYSSSQQRGDVTPLSLRSHLYPSHPSFWVDERVSDGASASLEAVRDFVACQGVPEDGTDQLIVGVAGGSCGLGEAGVGVGIRDQAG